MSVNDENNECIIGLDPGKKGAVAVVRIHDLEVYSVDVVPLSEGEIDLDGLNRIINLYRPSILQAYIEKVHAMPGQGVSSMFSFGRTFGRMETLLFANKIPTKYVHPTTWHRKLTKELKDTTPKKRTLALVRRYFPDVNLLATPRSRVPHDGIVDALAIALYGVLNARNERFESSNILPGPTVPYMSNNRSKRSKKSKRKAS